MHLYVVLWTVCFEIYLTRLWWWTQKCQRALDLVRCVVVYYYAYACSYEFFFNIVHFYANTSTFYNIIDTFASHGRKTLKFICFLVVIIKNQFTIFLWCISRIDSLEKNYPFQDVLHGINAWWVGLINLFAVGSLYSWSLLEETWRSH
jgi:hypothetical protein